MVMGAMLGVSGSAWAGGSSNSFESNIVYLAQNPQITFSVTKGDWNTSISDNNTIGITNTNYASWNTILNEQSGYSNGTGTFTLNFGFSGNNPILVKNSSGETYTITGINAVYLSPVINGLTANSCNLTGWNLQNSNPSYTGVYMNGFGANDKWIGDISPNPTYGRFTFNISSALSGTPNEQEVLFIHAQYTDSSGNTTTAPLEIVPVVPESSGVLLLLGGAAPLLGALVLFRRRLFSA